MIIHVYCINWSIIARVVILVGFNRIVGPDILSFLCLNVFAEFKSSIFPSDATQKFQTSASVYICTVVFCIRCSLLNNKIALFCFLFLRFCPFIFIVETEMNQK